MTRLAALLILGTLTLTGPAAVQAASVEPLDLWPAADVPALAQNAEALTSAWLDGDAVVPAAPDAAALEADASSDADPERSSKPPVYVGEDGRVHIVTTAPR